MRPISPATLTAAYAADLAFGDPEWMLHPVRLIGRLIEIGERRATPGASARHDLRMGAALSFLTTGAAYLGGLASCMHWVTEVALAWTTLATGSLLKEASAVIDALQSEDLLGARSRLSRIVGRDTVNLGSSEILRAVIETLAESLCDGIVAPLYYLALGGTPVAMTYKAINTLDSMIGHSEPPHRYFGRFAARLDDGANFVPARLTALLIVSAAFLHGDPIRAFRTWIADGKKHPSPNAAQSEAAMAGALRVRLGGMNYYDGVALEKPSLGEGHESPTVPHAKTAMRLTRTASLVAFACALAYTVWRRQ